MSVTGDGLDQLRIPYDKIKFGKKIETQGYGTVFEGEFDDQRVALKQLNITNLANIKPKLLAEILTISKFSQHQNLVALLGFCDEKSNEIILVYEYVASGNLEDKMRKRLSTIQRIEICLGAARGLCYLHTGVDSTTRGIVHGNVKLSKILLNSYADSKRFEAKVSSFGLSKIVPGKGQKVMEDEDEDVEKPTKESDVYSFGVLLLIVLCGVSELVDTDDYQERHVSELVPKKMKQDKLRKTVHFDIRKEIKAEALETYAKIACQCVMENPDDRPDMAKVVEELEKALRLQGGEVTYVQIPGSTNVEASVVDDGLKEDDSSTVVSLDSNIPEKEPDISTTEKDVTVGDKGDDVGEDICNEVTIVGTDSESSNGEKNTVEDTNTGGEVKYVQNSGNINIDETKGETVEDGSGVSLESNILLKELETENISTIEEDVKDLIGGDKVDDDKEDNGIVGLISESSNGVKNTMEASETESVTDKTHIEDAKNADSNDDPATENEILNDLNSEKESNITVENEDVDNSKIIINKEMSTTYLETPDETVDDFDSDKKSMIIEEHKADDKSIEISTTSKSSNGDTSNSTNQESVPENTHIEDAKNGNSNDNPVIEKEILNDLNSEKDSNITVENEEENKSKIAIMDADNEMNTIDQETTEETIDDNNDIDSNKEAKIIEEKKEDGESLKNTTTPESGIGMISTSTSQGVKESNMLLSDKGCFKEVNEDELERLRIPFEKIKFGQKIDVHGYGTMFEGEYDHQQVALKRLNITNLHNIKPKLLSAILTISRFQQHPNLVALIGFCDENNKEIVLVYEYVSGGNLADNMSNHLTTIQRLQICLGAARGIEYLHSGDDSVDSNPCIIHGNIKLSKILLNSDSNSSNFEAKVSGFGLPKLLPGHVEIVPKSMDPAYAATGELTKESDMYSFGVLLLEVLCGVPELVDTDDYQERHVTELVPKRLEQNMLRKIVHFDIRDEIATDSLETYAKIACRCVSKKPEERPTMPEVVVELEKALRLQGGKVSDVQIFGSSNGNSLPEVDVGEDDHEGDNNGEMMSSNITEEESKVIEETIDVNNKDVNPLGESFPVPISGGNDVESVPEDAETKNGDDLNDPESIEEITVDQKSMEISVENEVSNESKTTTPTKSDNGDDSNSAMGVEVSDVQLLASSNGTLPEVPVGEDYHEGDENGETVSSAITEEESKVIEETTDDIALEDSEKENVKVPESTEEITVDLNSNEESKIIVENEVNNESKITTSSFNSAVQEPLPDEISDTKEKGHGLMMNAHNSHIMEVQNSEIPDGNGKAGSLNTEKPELTVNDRGGDFSNSATQILESESKRSNSTSSESSNGDDTTPSDHLLPKSPDKVKKTSRGSSNCCYCFCCSCSWWQFISDRIVLYGGLFWNKLVSCFYWMTGQCSSKRD